MPKNMEAQAKRLLMRRYSRANSKDSFVICHALPHEFEANRYGICEPINGTTKWDLIEILENQDNENRIKIQPLSSVDDR